MESKKKKIRIVHYMKSHKLVILKTNFEKIRILNFVIKFDYVMGIGTVRTDS